MLWLVKNGVPWHIAESLPPEERIAYAVVMGTFEGGNFDWDTLTWDRRR